MIENGRIVSVFNMLGKIVGKTHEGKYVICLETGNSTILALTEFKLM
jgi:hypothetical protein